LGVPPNKRISLLARATFTEEQIGQLPDQRVGDRHRAWHEPAHSFGARAVAEIPLDGVAPAVANAVYDAIGVQVAVIPLTPERVWKALQNLDS
jgi:CO/xanthine dehydrogenase Mo-binding subunit